jgi:hypothetical protein
MPIHNVPKLIGLTSCAALLLVSSGAMAQVPNSEAAAPPSQPAAASPATAPPVAAFPPATDQAQPAAPQPVQAPAQAQVAPVQYSAPPADIQPNPNETLEAPEPAKPRRLALGLTTLKEHGFGGVLRLRFNHVALDATGGFMPLLIITSTVGGTTMDIDGAMSAHGGIGPVFFFSGDQKRFQNGLRVNGIYDQVMGPGGGLGWVGEITMTRFTIALGAGLQIYPEAEDRIREHFGFSSAVKLDALSTSVQLYVGLNLFWYLV